MSTSDTHTPDLPANATKNQDQSTAAPASAAGEERLRIFEPADDDQPQPTFAERVGQRAQRAPLPDPFGIAGDNLAGVRLLESRKNRQMIIKFDERPIQPAIDKIKEAGYRWNPTDQQWTHAVRQESAMATRVEAKRLYDEIRQMICDDKGIQSGQEVPF
ncbi:MAG TPA: hypothetical protein VF278_19460 [Pirellulales bacterium]